ncbi:MAG: hypothetical protein ACPHCI_08790, partial [Solirubrobacterales bacterium]
LGQTMSTAASMRAISWATLLFGQPTGLPMLTKHLREQLRGRTPRSPATKPLVGQRFCSTAHIVRSLRYEG